MEKHKPELEFMTDTSEILRILIHSKEFGNVVGVSSPLLGTGIFITAVEKVILDYEVIIHLKQCDVNGGVLEKNMLKLTDITSACSFKSRFDKIFHKKQDEVMHATEYSF
jgi:hypothetical protein